jgi:hypothetical protein
MLNQASKRVPKEGDWYVSIDGRAENLLTPRHDQRLSFPTQQDAEKFAKAKREYLSIQRK